MGTANTKSTIVTNADAAVQTLNSQAVADARARVAVATLEVAAADDDGSVYRFFRVHSSWRILSIRILNDAITGGTAYHCGLHQTAANGGAALDADCYASSVDINAGTAAWLEIGYEAAGVRAIEKIGQTVWEDGALTADSNRWYDLTMTGATVGTGAGTITMMILFTAGNS